MLARGDEQQGLHFERHIFFQAAGFLLWIVMRLTHHINREGTAVEIRPSVTLTLAAKICVSTGSGINDPGKSISWNRITVIVVDVRGFSLPCERD